MAKKNLKNNLRVMDFFCGAGGFSEGFRQQGFQIVKGIDFWQPAIDTHNLNHSLNDSVKNVLDFWSDDSADVIEIEKLEDTEFLIGSPSCVSFSLANRAGKADKTSGVRLIETYLRVIAVKKNKKNSMLKAWYMENVPQSRKFIREEYTFEHLNLSKWAKKNGFRKSEVALRVQGEILNAGDYGAPQERKRFITGEWIETGEFLVPQKKHEKHKTVSEVRSRMPDINELHTTRKKFTDPNYPSIQVSVRQLTDHFYDTGVHKIDWEKAEFLKTNHPFMGKMSFPENENRTSRTIMATRSASMRETLLYKSEYCRKGDGKYRLPTIREIASLMGFPYVYQFSGSEGMKWKQIGNSVCPHQSSALAKMLRKKMRLRIIPDDKVSFSRLEKNFDKVNNLNTFIKKDFDLPKKRQEGARFRRHALKLGNMTVDLMNYHPDKKEHVTGDWYVTAFFGTGNGYGVKIFSNNEKKKIEKVLENSFQNLEDYKKKLAKLTARTSVLQKIYEDDLHLLNKENPILLLKQLASIITTYDCHRDFVKGGSILQKENVPLAQLMSAYGLLTILNY